MIDCSASSIYAHRKHLKARNRLAIIQFLVSDLGDADKLAPPELKDIEDCFYVENLYKPLDIIDFRPKFSAEDNLVRAIHDIAIFRSKKMQGKPLLAAMRILGKNIDAGGLDKACPAISNPAFLKLKKIIPSFLGEMNCD